MIQIGDARGEVPEGFSEQRPYWFDSQQPAMNPGVDAHGAAKAIIDRRLRWPRRIRTVSRIFSDPERFGQTALGKHQIDGRPGEQDDGGHPGEETPGTQHKRSIRRPPERHAGRGSKRDNGRLVASHIGRQEAA
jgi:hypothetical protein